MSLKTKLEKSLNEKDVENIYREEILNNTKKAVITSPFNTDGLMKANNVRTLLEFKYDVNLKSKLSQSSVLIQCLYYIKKFEQAGEKLPSTIFVGDKNECFALHTNSVIKYLNEDIDWTIAPSSAHNHNAPLLKAMVDDTDILPFVYDIDEHFDIREVLQRIKDLSDNIVRKILVTKNNITTVFNYFNENVLEKSDLTTNQKANLFIQIIINPESNFLNPQRKNQLITKSYGKVKVNSRQFKSFFKHFDGEDYSPRQKEELTGIVDRLIEDTVRRNKGEFFTPTSFVDLAHEYLTDVYGEDWRERFVVWDNSAGTNNLTRDYKFKELYTSTLEQSDIDTSNQMGYNPGAVKFQFDFLNDPDSKLPQGLQEAINGGKEILFLINPPYARSAANGKNNTISKGTANTVVGEEMRATKKWGSSTSQLYAQFLYRIWKYQQKNKNIHIGIFCKPNYLTGGSFDKFRSEFFNNFGFEKGFLFQASHFSSVSTQWGINFAIFSNKVNNMKREFKHDLIDVNEDSFELEIKGIKNIYNIDIKNSLTRWMPKNDKTDTFPKLSSSLMVRETKWGSELPEGSFGTLVSNSNAVYKNSESVYLINGGTTENVGKHFVNKENFLKTTALFTARKTIKGNWINDKDEYLAPNEEHPKYRQFELDSLIYSLFNSSSQQSSLRQVDYKGKKWDIKNEFFWLSTEKIMELADENGDNEVYQDAKYSKERYMYELIEKHYDEFSPKAKEILDMATKMLVDSFKFRSMINEEHPEYHLNTWDAGYAQLKLIWGKYMEKDFKEFRKTYNEWSEELTPLIYELGFLK